MAIGTGCAGLTWLPTRYMVKPDITFGTPQRFTASAVKKNIPNYCTHCAINIISTD